MKNKILSLTTAIIVTLSLVTTTLSSAAAAESTQEAEIVTCSVTDNYMQANEVTINVDKLDLQGDYLETPILSDYRKNILSKVEEYYDVVNELCIGADGYAAEMDTYCNGDYKIYANSIYNDKTVIADGLITLNCTTLTAENSILYTTQNDIILNCGDVNYNGVIYAPEGNVCVNATTANFSRIIIAKTLEFNCGALALSPDYSLIDTDENFGIEETISFESDDDGVEKLIECGYNVDFIETIPQDVIDLISTSNEAINKISYYKEVVLSDENQEETSKVVPSSDEEFDYRTANAADDGLESEDDGISTFSTTRKIDSGTLKVTTTLFLISGGKTSQYMVISNFVWTTMPKYRGTDFFSITRDSNTAIMPGTFGSTISYYQQKYI